MQITITKPELFAAAARFVSTKQTHYYFRGVCIEPGGYIVATDGHRLFAGYDPDTTGIEEPTIIKPPKIKMPKKWFGKGELVLDGETARFNNETMEAREIEGSYPDWRRAVPRDLSGTADSVSYNFDYLADFRAVGEALKMGQPIITYNDGEPALLTYGRQDCFGIVMPLPNSAGGGWVPEWVNR